MRKCKVFISKINSIHYGGIWIAAGLIAGMVIPLLLWLIFHVFAWGFCIAGGIIIAAFFVVFAIEMHQDNSKVPYYERTLKETIPYDSENQYAVIRSSICTGEMVAGFKNYSDKHFVEVMLIRTPEDLDRFKKIYGLTEIKKEY